MAGHLYNSCSAIVVHAAQPSNKARELANSHKPWPNQSLCDVFVNFINAQAYRHESSWISGLPLVYYALDGENFAGQGPLKS